jgi:cell wall-associated NlpC family hydrolase
MRRAAVGAVALAVAGAAAALAGAGGGGRAAPEAKADRADDVVLTPDVVDPAAVKRAERAGKRSRARIVQLEGAGEPKTYASGDDYVSPGAPSDADVKAELRAARAELRRFKRYLGTTAFLQTGPRAKVLSDGTAVAPDDAPEPVKRVIQAANAIAKFPYKWGGGHGAWRDDGYDCSGSVSFALAGAGLLKSPMTSGGFMNYGEEGPGEWVTIYANGGHMFMVVAGLRFDTSGRGRAGTRWQEASRSASGMAVRHVPGL